VDVSSSLGNIEPLTVLSERSDLISSLSFRLEPSAFSLLAAVSGMLSVKDCLTLSPILWNISLDASDTKILSPVRSFLIYAADADIPSPGMFSGHAMCRKVSD
jgi:hypothetical protein